MKVFFIGTVLFSRRMLEVMVELDQVDIVGVATKSASKVNADHSDLSDLATAHGIPFKYVRDINAQHIVQWIVSLEPEVCFCLGWSNLINANFIETFPKGVIGYHPTHLPSNRGRHPLIWAIALGLEETASTFFSMDAGADSGPILDQQTVEITGGDTAATLYNKIIQVSQTQLRSFVPLLAAGTLVYRPQDHGKSNVWRKRGPQDGYIDFRMPSRGIFNLVRALTRPYIGAHLVYNEQEFKVWQCQIGPQYPANLEPGKVVETDGHRILVKTGDATIWLEEHELPKLPDTNEYIL